MSDCSPSASSSWGRRSMTTSPTGCARRSCCSPPKTRTKTSTCTSIRPADRSAPAWRSTTRWCWLRATSPPTQWAWRVARGECRWPAVTKGKRYALPHARILMHQPLGGVTGSAADIAIQAEQFHVIKKEMFRLNAEFTGQSIERIEADSDRDRWFTAQEALEYGFVDHIITRAAHITNGEPR